MSEWISATALVLSLSSIGVIVCSRLRQRARVKQQADIDRMKRTSEVCKAGFHASALRLILEGEDLESFKKIERGQGITPKHFTFEQLEDSGVSGLGMRKICTTFGLPDEVSNYWTWSGSSTGRVFVDYRNRNQKKEGSR